MRSSGNLCVEERRSMCRGRRARILLYLHIHRRDSPPREPSWSAFWLTTPTYTVRRDGPAREPSLSAFWLQKPSILRACVREEDAGGREAGAPSDLKMELYGWKMKLLG